MDRDRRFERMEVSRIRGAIDSSDRYKTVESVSGGTRWGGGLWINSEDLARFGLLILNKGRWQGKQIVSERWIGEATTLWHMVRITDTVGWLNTRQKQWPSRRDLALPRLETAGTLYGSIQSMTLCWFGTGMNPARQSMG